MGRIFLEHINGTQKLYNCAQCDTNLTNKSQLISTSNVQDRVMLTGRHMVRDVMCKNCKNKLGWMYEFATEESQRYKEGRVILEHALITESEGFSEFPRPRNYEEN
ncbi:protein yippee [Chironomus tepperi]|uniref:protein yippee n=1 Tax=Chironomus tepperi TaxID=113505 RepID=UPI00391F8D7E